MLTHACNATPYGSLFSWHWMFLYVLRHMLDRLEVHVSRVYVEESAGLEEVLEAIIYDRETKLAETLWRAQQGDIADLYVSDPAFQPGEPIEYLELGPWIVEFWHVISDPAFE